MTTPTVQEQQQTPFEQFAGHHSFVPHFVPSLMRIYNGELVCVVGGCVILINTDRCGEYGRFQ